ncbi:polysaccharide deacetylase family protein [Cylindrospermum sp. FACHB-282]|uniref:polysaccharide deacetylase family protein n=1 Tax=Cylindrospermum sp. FACHB-282 TaxID=2692794 RepID=UPI001684657B|nr:polysaccharide deacetylase family protein [Cylindrospermum sp. FACHB-282]MBD2385004.1 polysaccharide deacetylase family protein [Cylindrospermum sp. FACHB-282]
MSDQKLSRFLQVGIIVFGTAVGCFGMSYFLPKGEVNHLLAIKNPDRNITQAGLSRTVSAQAFPPAVNQMVEVPKPFAGTIIYEAKLKPNQKVIALTFDDGPSPKNTAQILEILKKNNIKATFFMVGQMVQSFPQIAKKVADDGHVLGNHTWHHWYRQMDTATAASEINRTADIIYKTTGVKTNLFRPPGGFLHNGLVDYAKSQKYAVMMWSSESGDSQRRGQAPTLVKNVLKTAKPGAIVLMHDGGGNRSRSVKALPQVITGLKSQGYRFVTIPELLEMQAQQPLATKSLPTVKN